ncbi:4-hydroxybenzoate geranyltransferase 2 [Carex littledalei]|uniref:4-hydroxybenzoate geranyltransferase 2 n=1 Tax=Carex littledalei TaxID=544730 RepID=A0A833VYT7_9POAL|nr:4-hydroxybenzoate geranyltransferase 2 [Carex littledalei]
MELSCCTFPSSPHYQRHTDNFQRTPFHNQPKRNIACTLHHKMLPAISEQPYPLSMFRGNKIICQSRERPAWLETTIPKPLRPYVMLSRLTRDIGFWIQAWPSYWSIALATSPGAIPDIKLMVLLGCISLLIKTSGCTIDDLHDIEFDKQVERSKKRPLASGELTPLQGWCFWVYQLLLLTPLLLQLNKLSLGFAAAQQILIFLYPLMKRVTYLPQAFLGITINWSALVGWTAVTGNLVNTNVFLPIYIGGVFWTIAYDTIYAHQDKKDDVKAGVKSSALLFGNSSTYWTLGFAAVCIGSLDLGVTMLILVGPFIHLSFLRQANFFGKF